MLYKELEQITEKDLDDLILNSVPEFRQIEYKKQYGDFKKVENKKEFLADVSSFANCIGGDLIIGIECDAESKLPINVSGINIENSDDEIQRLHNIIKDSISPNITNVLIKVIELKNSNHAIIIRIPRSWNLPHRAGSVTKGGFYTRNSNGKYSMEVDELRNTFILSDNLNKRIKDFRLERLNSIFINESYIPLYEGGKIVLHLIPLSSIHSSGLAEIFVFDNFLQKELQPLKSSGWDVQYNLEGFMSFTNFGSYTQLFRSGIIEAVESEKLRKESGLNIIPATFIEKMIMQSFNKYVNILRTLKISVPVAIFVSLVNIKGYSFQAGQFQPIYPNKHPHRKEILNLREVIIQNWDEPGDKIFRPIFDSLWNAYGYIGSVNYNEHGNWTQKAI